MKEVAMATVLKGGTLIDGTGRAPISPAVVVADGEWITDVGKDSEVSIPANAEIIDVTGKTMVPGLIDNHSHLLWDAIHDLKEQCLNDSPETAAFKAAMNCRKHLTAGVTTIRELSSGKGLVFKVQMAKAAGLLSGPRIFHCGTHLCITGGHVYFFGIQCDGVEEVRKTVREQIKYGATWIKMMGGGSREEALSPTLTRTGPSWIHLPAREGEKLSRAYPDFTREEIAAAIEEAHRAGRKVTVDVSNAEAMRDFFELGVDCLEHGGPYDDEMLKLMVDKGIWLCPTLSPSHLQATEGEKLGLAPYEIERRREGLERRAKELRRAVDAGVKLVMGTDAGSPAVPHDRTGAELEAMVATGLCKDAMEAIVVSTRNGAEMLGVLDKLGTLEANKLADILVIDGDPLEDLAALSKVSRVYLGGELMVKDGVVQRPM
jgi:imidazolonepropionase-like amidohydrolase